MDHQTRVIGGGLDQIKQNLRKGDEESDEDEESKRSSVEGSEVKPLDSEKEVDKAIV